MSTSLPPPPIWRVGVSPVLLLCQAEWAAVRCATVEAMEKYSCHVAGARIFIDSFKVSLRPPPPASSTPLVSCTGRSTCAEPSCCQLATPCRVNGRRECVSMAVHPECWAGLTSVCSRRRFCTDAQAALASEVLHGAVEAPNSLQASFSAVPCSTRACCFPFLIWAR